MFTPSTSTVRYLTMVMAFLRRMKLESCRLDEPDRDIDVAARRPGVRTGGVRILQEAGGERAVEARQGDVEAHAEEEAVIRLAEVHLRVDREVARQRDL